MAGSYPRAFAPSLPVGYSNLPADEIEISAYFFLITFLISSGVAEVGVLWSGRHSPEPFEVGQAGGWILLFISLLMALINYK